MDAVLFDLDNTLLIKRPTVAEKWWDELNRAGFSITHRDADRAFARCEMWVGETIRRENETGVRLSDDEFLQGVMVCCLESLCIAEEAAGIISDVWAGKYEKSYEVAEGVIETLENLWDKGIALGIVSNNSSAIRDVLNELGLMKYFSAVIISDEVGLFKPDPGILLLACDKLGVKPEKAVYVGDHPFDVVCAHDANVHSAWIPISEYMKLPESAGVPDYRLNKLTDLIDCI